MNRRVKSKHRISTNNDWELKMMGTKSLWLNQKFDHKKFSTVAQTGEFNSILDFLHATDTYSRYQFIV